MRFKLCTRCGAHLDPGERCNCEYELDELRQTEATVKVVAWPHTQPEDYSPKRDWQAWS